MRVADVIGRGTATAMGILAVALALGACGGSAKKSTSTARSASAMTVPAKTATSATTARPLVEHKAAKALPPAKIRTTPASTSHAATTHAATSTHPATTTESATTPAYTGPMHATLAAQNHEPTVNKPWVYTVTAADANGRPLSGTVDVEFTFNGTVVGHDKPPTHPVRNGRWSDNLEFPPAAIGEPLDLQVVVHTSLGSTTLDWPVKVKK